MSAASNYTEANVINALLRGVAFPVPSATYVSLHTASPAETGGSEVSTGAHASRLSRAQRTEGGMIGTVTKRPGDRLDYDVDFSHWLTPGDTITSATAVVSPADELIVESVQIVDQSVKVWLTGGEDEKAYSILVTVATSGGRIKEIEFKLRVRDC